MVSKYRVYIFLPHFHDNTEQSLQSCQCTNKFSLYCSNMYYTYTTALPSLWYLATIKLPWLLQAAQPIDSRTRAMFIV